MSKKTSSNISYGAVFKLLWSLSSGMRLAKFAAIASPTLWAIWWAVSPYLQGRVVNAIFSASKTGHKTLITTLAVLVGMLLTDYIVWSIYGISVNKNALHKLRTRFIEHFYKKLLSQDAGFYQNESAGALAAKVSKAALEIKPLIENICWGFLRNTVTFIGLIPVLAGVSKIIMGLTLTWIVLFTIISWQYHKWIQEASAEAFAVNAQNTGKIVDTLASIKTVRSFNGQEREAYRASLFLDQEEKATIKVDSLFESLWRIYRVSYFAYFISILSWMVWAGLNGFATPGDFLLVFQLFGMIGFFWWFLIFNFAAFASATSAIWTVIQAIEEHKPNVVDQPQAISLTKKRGAIELKDVCFGYPGGTRRILKNFNLLIEPGQKVGLVGRSGSGKTTLINLLTRNFDVNSGQIFIDNQDTKLVTLKSLRDSIALIEQEPILFDRTLIENLRYGKEDATEEEVFYATKVAHADGFIDSLSEKYNYLVGERGSKLSGGQRQRIAIARAVLKDSPIVIFDEATSQLDTIVEQDIKEALHGALANKTVLFVAHRLSTIEQMDRILVFEHGKIVQDGPHQLLAQLDGVYKNLLAAQKNKKSDFLI